MENSDVTVGRADTACENPTYINSTVDIVSMVAYLIGVPVRIFENEHEPIQMSIFERLQTDRAARIIRHLCIIRTSIERNFRAINLAFLYEHKSVYSLPAYFPNESISQLSTDGIDFVKKSSVKLNQHIIEINRLVSDRINNCKHLFPLWVNWQYIRELFVMPNGLTEAGVKNAGDVYCAHLLVYPYQMYINWDPHDEGNILYNDKKFLSLLYQWHNDVFTEYSKVSDARDYVKGSIYSFVEDGEKIIVVVDCENSDPYKLCATLSNLNYDQIKKIAKIILFDDAHTVAAWQILEKYTHIPVEHILIQRVKQNKSLVDIKLTARACQEHYQNAVDSFIIVSSDSDYWGLISSLPDARFLVMIEREKCGPDMKAEMKKAGIFYCYIDDFYSGNTEDIKMRALFSELYRYIGEHLDLNAKTMLNEALRATRLPLSDAEKRQIYEKYIKRMKLVVAEDGQVSIELNT
jgi:hypothetical protein